MLLAATIISFLINYASSDCKIDNRSPTSIYEKKLRYDIRNCTYAPTHNIKEVVLLVHLKTFYFDDNEELFTVYVWLYMKWQDRRSQWKPEDYGGITNTQISSAVFWTPMMFIFHKEDYYNTDDTYSPLKCKINNNGNSTCVVPSSYTVTCKTALENWPFDSHICAFKLGTTGYVQEDLIVKSKLYGVGDEEHRGWRVVYHDMVKNFTKNTNTSMLFVVERQALSIAAIIILPSIILVVLIIATVYLDFKNNVRLGLTVFILLANFHMFQTIGELIPHYGSDTPTIILLIRSSIWICTFSICLCLVLRLLSNKISEPHRWIIVLNEYLLKSRYKILFSRKVADLSPDDETAVNSWTEFACIVNNFYFYVTLVIYFILLIVYVPRPKTIDINIENYFESNY